MNEQGDEEGSHEKIGNMLKKIERILAAHKKTKGSDKGADKAPKKKVEEDEDQLDEYSQAPRREPTISNNTVKTTGTRSDGSDRIEPRYTGPKIKSSPLSKSDDSMRSTSSRPRYMEEDEDNMNMVANRHSELELNEWANTAQNEEKESFITDEDFMIRQISGGLNNQKQDQTLVGSGPSRVVTQTEREDVNQSMGALLKRLDGIN
jgi:hypothetical protein